MEPAIISKREYSAFQVNVSNELKLLAPDEEGKSLKSKENYIYLLYCNSAINTPVGEWCLCVPCQQFKEGMLTHLFIISQLFPL